MSSLACFYIMLDDRDLVSHLRIDFLWLYTYKSSFLQFMPVIRRMSMITGGMTWSDQQVEIFFLNCEVMFTIVKIIIYPVGIPGGRRVAIGWCWSVTAQSATPLGVIRGTLPLFLIIHLKCHFVWHILIQKMRVRLMWKFPASQFTPLNRLTVCDYFHCFSSMFCCWICFVVLHLFSLFY